MSKKIGFLPIIDACIKGLSLDFLKNLTQWTTIWLDMDLMSSGYGVVL
jgi:hypothetical protein